MAKKKVEVLLSEKDIRYLKVLAMLKNKKGLSDTIRMIIEEYKRSNVI